MRDKATQVSIVSLCVVIIVRYTKFAFCLYAQAIKYYYCYWKRKEPKVLTDIKKKTVLKLNCRNFMLPFFRLIGQQLKMHFSHPLPWHSRHVGGFCKTAGGEVG